MYKLKQIPEDFIVKEIPNKDFSVSNPGRYTYFLLKKKDYTTISALQVLSKRFKLPLKNFGFAGNKDRRAVTEQYTSIFYGRKEMVGSNFNDIKLEYLGQGNSPVCLGDLTGNEFIITIRNLANKDINKIKNYDGNFLFPNYFGSQRFSDNNCGIGKAIITKNFREAAGLLSRGDKAIIDSYLEDRPTDYIGALRNLPLKIRKMHINAYQSGLFNKTLWEFLKSNKKIKNFVDWGNFFIPIVGFGLELDKIENEEIKKIITGLMSYEGIVPRDFIIPQMPELTSEGTERKAFAEVKDFKVLETGEDESNENKQKAIVKFKLGKGSYATVAVDYALDGCKNILNDLF